MQESPSYKPLMSGAPAPQRRPQGAMYPDELTQPMRDELVRSGVKELVTAEDVQREIAQGKGTAAVLINSVCGCAAGAARPGYVHAVSTANVKPTRVLTAFAGVHPEAVAAVRALVPAPASSPSIILFKDGQPLAMMHRSDIEVRDGRGVSDVLQKMFAELCA